MPLRKPPPWFTVALIVLTIASLALQLYSFFNVPNPPSSYSEGPKLEDVAITSSTYGRHIPRLYGTTRLGGNVIWTSGIDEVAVTLMFKQRVKTGFGRKKTQKSFQIVYLYFSNFAVAFAEGMTGGLLKVFLNNKLVHDATSIDSYTKPGHYLSWYDGFPLQPPFDYTGITQVSTGASGLPSSGSVVGSIVSSAVDPNLPDSIDLGVDAPAYRNLAYLLFDALPLVDYGNRLPQVSCILSRVPETNPIQFDIDFGSPAVAGGTRIMILRQGLSGSDYLHLEAGTAGNAYVRWMDSNHNVIQENVLQDTAGSPVALTFGSGAARTPATWARGLTFYAADDNDVLQITVTGRVIARFPQAGNEILAMMIIPGSHFGFLSVFGLAIPIPDALVFAQIAPANGCKLLGYALTLGGPDYASQFALGPQGSWCLIGGSSPQDTARVQLYFYSGLHFDDQQPPLFSEQPYDLTGTGTTLPGHKDGNTSGVDFKGTNILMSRLSIDGTYLILNGLSGGAGRIGKWDLGLEDFVWVKDTLSMWDGTSAPVHQWINYNRLRSSFISAAPGGGLPGKWLPIIGSDNDTIRYLDLTNGNVWHYTDSLSNWNGTLTDQDILYDWTRYSLWIPRTGVGANNGPTEILLGRLANFKDTVDFIIEDQVERVGLSPTDLDTTDVAGVEVQGYSTTRQGEVRANLIPLMGLYDFGYTESDWVLKFRSVNQTPTDTIDSRYIGVDDSKGDPDQLSATRKQETDVATGVALTYLDTGRDFQPSTQYARRIHLPFSTSDSESEETLQLPMSLDASEAATLARRLLARGWTHRTQVSSSFLPRYLKYDPLDSVVMVSGSDSYDVLLSDTSVGGGLAILARGVSNDASIYSVSHPGDEVIFPGQKVIVPWDSELIAMDVGLLFDNDYEALRSEYVVYATIGYTQRNATSWPGADAWYGPDQGNLLPWFASDDHADWGISETALPAPTSSQTFDTVNTLVVRMTNGTMTSAAATASKTQLENFLAKDLVSGGVFALLGDEVIQAMTVVDNGDGTFDLSDLLRGRRGTDWAVASHGLVGERFVVLNDLFVSKEPLGTANATVYYRAVTRRQQPSSAQMQIDAFVPRSLMPNAPCSIAGQRLANNDLVVRWIRRARSLYEQGWGDGESSQLPPILEHDERYEAALLTPTADIVNLHNYDSASEVLVQLASAPAISTTQVVFNVNMSVFDNGDGTCRISAAAGPGTYDYSQFQLYSWVRTIGWDNDELNTVSVVVAVDPDYLDLKIPKVTNKASNPTAQVHQVPTFTVFAEQDLINAGYGSSDPVRVSLFQLSQLVGRGHPGAAEVGP